MAGKQVRLHAKFQSKKCAKIIYGDNDRISQLPDDILVHIVSFLSLKEAVSTSLLSSRWLNLWKHTPRLIFDAHISLEKIAQGLDKNSVKRRKYVRWVNCIIRKHKATALKEFRICLDLTQSAKKVIVQWLKFAFVRQVQSLELNFSPKYEYLSSRSRFQFDYCPFPEEFLTQNTGEASASQHPSDSSPVDFKSLRVLSLKCVDVTSEAIQFFLRNCPLLEKLVVDGSHKLLNLDVCGPSLVLKHLELTRCLNLKSVKVSASNLTSLIIILSVQELLLENVRKLVVLSVDCWDYGFDGGNKLLAFSGCIFQLEILTLHLKAKPEGIVVPSTFLELPKLKKLVVTISHLEGDKSLMGVTSLIRASPYLHEFVLKILGRSRSRSRLSLDREVNNNIKFLHQHLKVFKFYYYYGHHPSDVELLLRYVVENCVVLEKVIIDPQHVPQNPDESVTSRAVKDYAKRQLEAQVPLHIELIIL